MGTQPPVPTMGTSPPGTGRGRPLLGSGPPGTGREHPLPHTSCRALTAGWRAGLERRVRGRGVPSVSVHPLRVEQGLGGLRAAGAVCAAVPCGTGLGVVGIGCPCVVMG